MYALLAGVTGGYQHVPFVLPAPVARTSSWPRFSLPQATPSRSGGAFMWTPTWRAPVTVETSAPRRERRRHVFMWLFTSIRNVAALPVRVSVAAARAMRSMCLHLRRPWSARYDTDTRSLPGARGSTASLAPSPAQRRAREARIKTLVRLDSEGVFSSLTKPLLDPTRLVADPTHLTSAIERNLDNRAPLLNWHIKHHSPAGVYDGLTTSGSMLEAFVGALQIPGPDQVEAQIAEKRRQVAAFKAGSRNVGEKARRAVSKRAAGGKGVELKEALMPMVNVEYKKLIEAAWRNPTRAPAILLPGVRTFATVVTWRLSSLTGVGDRRAIMDSVLCQTAYTVASCRAQVDPDACYEGSECRDVLDGSCQVPDDSR
jgi:hypothetical protein